MDTIWLLGNAIVLNAPYLVGFILPPIVEILNRDIRKDSERHIVSLFVCLLAAILLHWGKLSSGNLEEFAGVTGIIFLESNTLFKLYFANSVIRESIQDFVSPKQVTESEIISTVNQP